MYGERPFAGNALDTLTRALMKGEVRAPPKGVVVPAKLRQVLMRGLAKAPEDRWPSIDALLIELRRLTAPPRWRAVALGIGLSALGVAWWQRPAAEQIMVRERCEGVEARLEGVWDASRRLEVEAAILRTGTSFAPELSQRLEARLDDYAGTWVRQYTEACEAAGSLDGRAEEDTAPRFQCLSERRAALREAVTVIAGLNEATVLKAADVVEGLPRLARCDDVEALRADLPPPEDPALAAEVERVRGQLARAKSLYDAGAIDEQRAELEAVVVRAEKLGWAPLFAEALTQSARARTYDPSIEADMERGFLLALEHGHYAVAAFAARELTRIVGYEQARYEEGSRWGRMALALANRPGAGSDAKAGALIAIGKVAVERGDLEAALEHGKAALQLRSARLDPHDPLLADALESVGVGLGALEPAHGGNPDEALPYLERALSIRQAAFGLGHPLVEQSLQEIARVHARQGRLDAALEAYQRALAAAEAELGPEHPSVARLLTGTAVVSIQRGSLDEALVHARRALALQEATFGPVHEELVYPLETISQALLAQGKLEEARQHQTRLLELVESIWSPEHPKYLAGLDAVGDTLSRQGQPERALDFHRRALESTEASLGSKHPLFATRLRRLGCVLREQGRLDEAVESFERSQALVDASMSPEDWRFASEPHFAIVEIKLEQGKHEEARALAERGVENLETSGDRATELAWGRFLLAQALWPQPSERVRATTLAEQARGVLTQAQAAFPGERLDEVQAWLEEHAAAR